MVNALIAIQLPSPMILSTTKMSNKFRECVEKCLKCGRHLIVVGKNNAGCPAGHGRLTGLYTIKPEDEKNKNKL